MSETVAENTQPEEADDEGYVGPSQGVGATGNDVHYRDAMEEILALIKGRVPLIWVQTHEENRFITEFAARIGDQESREVWLWSGWQGLTKLQKKKNVARADGNYKESWRPDKALDLIVEMPAPDGKKVKGITYIMRDFHTILREPIPRQIRDIYHYLSKQGKTLIVTSPVLAHGPAGERAGLPPTLEKQISVVPYELPNYEAVKGRLERLLTHMKRTLKGKPSAKDTKLEYTATEISEFAKALTGLTMHEIENAVAASITHLDRLDVKKLILEKKQVIRKSEILEFIEADVSLNDVGGLDLLKDYLKRYSRVHSDEAKEYGAEPIKGVLFVGVPGTGKSLASKAVGELWKEPLLRLDVGKVMTGLVGGSEGKMREVIQQAEAMAPCILWIDEVEKSLAGTKSSNFSDGGTLARVFGTLLSAMQEGLKGVTIVATANDITMLPPEFIRRFDEVFFVDLPGPDERWEILAIHFRKRGRDVEKFAAHKAEILKACHNYTGAELEKAVKTAVVGAFQANKPDVGHKDLLAALSDTKPIAQVMKEKIKKVREQARDRYRYASSYAQAEATKNTVETKAGKKLDVDEALDGMPELTSSKKEKKDTSYDGEDDSRFSDMADSE